ncbi:CFI-box-CTERM domain-containing protein [Halioglobus sp. HI00S01]|uniref:CFI-box-CTERM domain-containing protein n=1 Tax=Halioglobus sp. HI00S01 TaxID=1822214 RepID=UPI00350FE833
MPNNDEWVSASEIGKVDFCPRSYHLYYTGSQLSRSAKQNLRRGTLYHDEITEEIDQRCFIASYLYGPSDKKTNLLRAFRDSCLLQSTLGRIFVRSYYIGSPYLVALCTRLPLLERLVRYCTDTLVRRISS